MTRIVNVHEAKTHLSRLLEQAHAGEEIILAKSGKPYARRAPAGSAGRTGG
jgi:prevent-host-death family protein